MRRVTSALTSNRQRPIVREFPHLQVRVTYQLSRTREEAIAPYEIRVRWGTMTRRAWIKIEGPGHWTILEERVYRQSITTVITLI